MAHARFRIDLADSPLAPVGTIVAAAQQRLDDLLRAVARDGGLTVGHYVRYLSFQHHLTRNVQRAFLAVAAHETLADRRTLREFLFDFALEEEPHSDIARRDLSELGHEPLPCPLDVKLWWAYFDTVIPRRPFVRLGATCVLENLGAGVSDVARRLLAGAAFITQANSRFIQIHFHEALPHGDQIYTALASARLSAEELEDLRQGAREGSVMYLRMAAWALRQDPLLEVFSGSGGE